MIICFREICNFIKVNAIKRKYYTIKKKHLSHLFLNYSLYNKFKKPQYKLRLFAPKVVNSIWIVLVKGGLLTGFEDGVSPETGHWCRA